MYNLRQIKQRLGTLEKNWNPKYWVFVGGGSFCLMKYDKNGHQVVTDDGGMDERYVIKTFNIPCDGGDW